MYRWNSPHVLGTLRRQHSFSADSGRQYKCGYGKGCQFDNKSNRRWVCVHTSILSRRYIINMNRGLIISSLEEFRKSYRQNLNRIPDVWTETEHWSRISFQRSRIDWQHNWNVSKSLRRLRHSPMLCNGPLERVMPWAFCINRSI